MLTRMSSWANEYIFEFCIQEMHEQRTKYTL